MVFSVAFFSQVQFMADCLPQEQVALAAQTHSSDRPQQVVGLTIFEMFGLGWIGLECIECEEGIVESRFN